MWLSLSITLLKSRVKTLVGSVVCPSTHYACTRANLVSTSNSMHLLRVFSSQSNTSATSQISMFNNHSPPLQKFDRIFLSLFPLQPIPVLKQNNCPDFDMFIRGNSVQVIVHICKYRWSCRDSASTKHPFEVSGAKTLDINMGYYE